jgi:hypothetical protein
MAQRLIVKRTKIAVSIILRESDESSKYELFQRLNTGGSPLSEQEVRNSILVMINKRMYEWILDLSQDQNFVECAALTDRALEERYDMDLALRFIVFRTLDSKDLSKIGDMGDFLTEKMIELAKQKRFAYRDEENAFMTTFDLLKRTVGSDSFRKYDASKGRFSGGFLVSGFEVVALGIGYNYETLSKKPIDIRTIIEQVWRNENFTSKSGSGVRASSRVPNTVPLGRKIFKPA